MIGNSHSAGCVSRWVEKLTQNGVSDGSCRSLLESKKLKMAGDISTQIINQQVEESGRMQEFQDSKDDGGKDFTLVSGEPYGNDQEFSNGNDASDNRSSNAPSYQVRDRSARRVPERY